MSEEKKPRKLPVLEMTRRRPRRHGTSTIQKRLLNAKAKRKDSG